MADPDWCKGRYLELGKEPRNGLAVARMAAHITYLSRRPCTASSAQPAGPRPKSFSFNADFQVESYLRHQGSTFVDRFDANSYLYITRAIDYFDLGRRARRRAGQRLQGHQDALLRGLLHQRLAVPDARKPRDRAGAERGGGQRQLRRDRVRQGPRRLPAGEPELFATVTGFLNAAAEQARAQPPKGAADARPQHPAPAPRRPPADRRDGGAGSRVLDVGCGDGALLQLLADTKNVDGRGIEVSRERVNACVARGLSVIQGDADRIWPTIPMRPSTTPS
jgi:hypothetical protein